MAREDEIIKERTKKIEELRKRGVNPYPYSYDVKDKISNIINKNVHLKAEEKTKQKVKIAGRLMSLRLLGKINFAHVQDASGKIQIVIEKNTCKNFELFNLIDAGDFIGVEGVIFKTKRGELSILVEKIELLSKALLPLPEKWHGLKDPELRYRKRYIDLAMNPEIREIFIKRARIIEATREFLNAGGFMEVETPLLQPIYGGAEARPFKTELWARKMTLYMSISPELYLKRLIVGGYDKVYTICKNFRNEGIDRTHNPEFTMMECYQAYADYNDMIKLTEELFEFVTKKVLGKTEIEYQGTKLSFKTPFKKMTFYDALKSFVKIDAKNLSDELLRKEAEELKINTRGMQRGHVINEIFKAICEKNLIQPTHIIDHPKETSPLCKAKRNEPELIERVETFINGMEMTNGYSELNDPILQKELLKKQAEELKRGKEDASPLDEDFINAIEQGMPPTGGLGIGIDRFVMLLTNSPSIRDVIFFPFMKQSE